MKVSNALAIIALACGMGWAQAALADDTGAAAGSGKTVVEKVLDIMLQSEQISRSQYDELLQQSQEEQIEAAAAAAAAAEPASPAVSAGPTDWTFKWSNGFKLDRNDGAFKLKFGGRIMTDAALIWDHGLGNDFVAAGLDPKDGSGVEFRRARLFFQGTVYERLFFKAQYDWANTGDGNTDLKDLYLGLKKLGPVVRDVRIGHFKEPFMLQEMTSSKYITFIERGLNNVFYPSRNVGIMATGSPLEKRLQWQVGLFRNTNDQGFSFDDWGMSQYDVAARVAGAPLYKDDGEYVLHLGVAYIHQFRDRKTETLRYRQRPETHLAQRWVDTGSIAAGDSDILNYEIAGVCGPFSLQGEFTHTYVEGGPGGGKNLDLWGAYAQMSWFITGEHRAYQLGKASFGRVKPKANFNPSQGDWGAFEVAARYSYLNLDDRNLMGGKLWDATAGLNWYLFPNMRFMFNYVYADVGDRVASSPSGPFKIDGSGHIAQMRAQIDF